MLYWNTQLREEYSAKHHHNNAAVKLNDVFFAGQAVLFACLSLLQFAFFDRAAPQQLNLADKVLHFMVVGLATALLAYTGLALVIAYTSEQFVTWLTFVLILPPLLMLEIVVENFPQVWLNCKSKSTSGFSIVGVWLDLIGSSLSLSQLVFDAWSSGDWEAVLGNPAKLALGFVSLLYDFIFLLQHYVLFSS